MAGIGKGVLIVDDNWQTREWLCDLTREVRKVKEFGHGIAVAYSGEEGIERLGGSDLPPLAIINWEMREMAAKKIIGHIKEKRLLVKTLVISHSVGAKKDAEGAGCNKFLETPLDFTRFSEAVEQLLTR